MLVLVISKVLFDFYLKPLNHSDVHNVLTVHDSDVHNVLTVHDSDVHNVLTVHDSDVHNVLTQQQLNHLILISVVSRLVRFLKLEKDL